VLESILANSAASAATPREFVICTMASLVLGLMGALVYMYRSRYTKSFVLTLTLLPAIVQMVIMLVNGNLGTGVAVMGAFSLVRFRSVAGTAREISSIFLAMAIGLATGMGYLAIALLFLVIIGIATVILTASGFGEYKGADKSLKVTIPEDLDYTHIFDDLLAQYTSRHQLVKVRTTNMGSLYELQYDITLRDIEQEKLFLDSIRCRNGNLNIVCGRRSAGSEEL